MRLFGPFISGLCLAISCITRPTHAAPPSVDIKYLATKDVTLMDLGILRLESRVATVAAKLRGDVKGAIFFDWSSQVMNIILSPSDLQGSFPKPISETDAAEWCKEAFSEIREDLGVDPQTGEPSFTDSSAVGTLFNHMGFSDPKRPETVDLTLDRITSLVGITGYGTCSAPLLSSKVGFAPN